jgi:hypothetical protein
VKTITAYTDYSFGHLGDVPYNTTPVRDIVLTRFDGNRTVYGVVEGGLFTSLDIKHVYQNERRRDDPRCIPISKRLLRNLEPA